MTKLLKWALLSNKQRSTSGFTLIELLIVIAVIGVLAVGLLIALDPVEQTMRARDSGLVTSSADIKSAILRFYASKSYYPWCTDAACTGYVTGCASTVTAAATPFTTAGNCAANVLAALKTSGDIKSTLVPDSKLTLMLEAAPADLNAREFQIAFIPYSKSQRTVYAAQDSNAVYTTFACTTPGASGTCTGTTTTCYYCTF